MKIIVVTGGIGSGKSLVSGMLSCKGVPVYDCDTRAKAMYELHPELKSLLVADIFSKPEALERLENALFPFLMDDFREWAGFQKREFVAMESATLLQKKFFDNFGDYVLLVDAPVQLRLQRAVQRGGNEQDILRRMDLQGDNRNNPRVDFILDNDASVQDAEAQLDKFLKKINYGKREN